MSADLYAGLLVLVIMALSCLQVTCAATVAVLFLSSVAEGKSQELLLTMKYLTEKVHLVNFAFNVYGRKL